MNNPSERARKKAQEILDHYYKSHQERCDHTDLLNEIVEAFHIEVTTPRILSDEELDRLAEEHGNHCWRNEPYIEITHAESFKQGYRAAQYTPRDRITVSREQLEEWRDAILSLRDSMYPHPHEHSAMYQAKENSKEALESIESVLGGDK